MNKEDAEKKRDYHNKRWNYYNKKAKELNKPKIGFVYNKKRKL